jgi:hypothetical protein
MIVSPSKCIAQRVRLKGRSMEEQQIGSHRVRTQKATRVAESINCTQLGSEAHYVRDRDTAHRVGLGTSDETSTSMHIFIGNSGL